MIRATRHKVGPLGLLLTAFASATGAHAQSPFLAAATYTGGDNSVRGIAMDTAADGSVFIAGYTGFPSLPNAVNTKSGFIDIFVMKFSADLTTLHWSAYVGGVGAVADIEFATDCAATADGGVLVTGKTETPDFPVVNAIDDELNGPSDAVLFKLDADGSLVFSTYIGGSGGENADGLGLGAFLGEVEVAPDGSIFVAGDTRSADFPLVNPIDSTFGGFNSDVFIMKISADGQTILASTFIGDEYRDQVWGMRLDSEGRPVIVGDAGPGWPYTNGSFAWGVPSSSGVVYVTKLASDLQSYVWSSRLDRVTDSGGHIWFHEMAIGPDDSITIAGEATGGQVPVPSTAYQPMITQGSPTRDAIALTFAADGSDVTAGTFLGVANAGDFSVAVAVDALGQVLLTTNKESPGPTNCYKFDPAMTTLLTDPVLVAHPGSSQQIRRVNGTDFVVLVAGLADTTPGAFQEAPGGMYLARWDMQDSAVGGPAADLNGDGVVNGADLAAMLAQWGGAGSADLDGDGDVDGVDLAELLASWS